MKAPRDESGKKYRRYFKSAKQISAIRYSGNDVKTPKRESDKGMGSTPDFDGGGDEGLLSVKTHRRVATGNTKSREVAGALAGTAPSVNSPESGIRLCFEGRGACHLTYT